MTTGMLFAFAQIRLSVQCFVFHRWLVIRRIALMKARGRGR